MRIIDTTWIVTEADAKKAIRFAEQVMVEMPVEGGTKKVPREAIYWFLKDGKMPGPLELMDVSLPGEPHRARSILFCLDEMIMELKRFASANGLKPQDTFPGSVLVLSDSEPSEITKRGAMCIYPEGVP